MKHYRILVLGKFRNWVSMYLHGVIEGTIANGWQSERVEIQKTDGDKRWDHHIKNIYEQIARFRPHIMFTNSIFGTDCEYVPGILKLLGGVKKEYGTIICHQMGDPRKEPRYKKKIDKFVDLALFNFDDYDVLNTYATTWNIPCYFWPIGCWNLNTMQKTEYKYDMVFTGNRATSNKYIERTMFLEDCYNHADVFKLIWLPRKRESERGDFITNTRFYTTDIVSISKSILGVSIGSEFTGYIDARPFQYGGAGGLVFQWRLPGFEKLFIDNEHLVFFDNLDVKELDRLYGEYVLKSPEKGQEIREKAFNFMQMNHSYRCRVKDVVDVIEGRLSRPRVYLEDF